MSSITKNIVIYGIWFVILALQTGCMPNNTKCEPASSDNSVNYNSERQAQINGEPLAKKNHSSVEEKGAYACSRLHQAISLSMLDGEQQSDEELLILLSDIKRNTVLSNSDLQFNDMLLQRVFQKQDLRKNIAVQKRRLKNAQTQNIVLRNQLKTLQLQLNQLKNIEIEIDRKERSVTNPIDE